MTVAVSLKMSFACRTGHSILSSSMAAVPQLQFFSAGIIEKIPLGNFATCRYIESSGSVIGTSDREDEYGRTSAN